MKTLLLTLCFLVLCLFSYAQVDSTYKSYRKDSVIFKRNWVLFAGYYYYNRSAFETGIGNKSEAIIGHHPFASGLYISGETFYDNNWFIAPKIGVWASGGASAITLGLSTVYYTNFKISSLQARPEIGVGMGAFAFIMAEICALPISVLTVLVKIYWE